MPKEARKWAIISIEGQAKGLRKEERRVGIGGEWPQLKDEELLDVPLRELPLRIEGTALERRVQRLYRELEKLGIQMKPHVWLSEEWFTPDGVAGIAIPFYLAHPRLVRLERNQMLEVEGGTTTECMRLLRHEAGHAIDNAYRLHSRKRWRELFGAYGLTYPHSYNPKPNSQEHVLHLGAWYAQAHPAEDFAETFAVWLTPGSDWRARYQGWPALQKLEYVDQLMQQIGGTEPKNMRRHEVEPLSQVEGTLRQHYERKRQYYARDWPPVYDEDLLRVFSRDAHSGPTAAGFLRRIRTELRHAVAQGTGVHHYTVDHIMRDMIERCRTLRLRVSMPEEDAREKVVVMLTAQVTNVVHAGYSPIIV